MSAPYTYRARLLIYSFLLMAFLVGVLLFSYNVSRNAILDHARKNVVMFAEHIEGRTKLAEHDLKRSARMIRDNLQLKEYMFIVVSVHTESSPLKDLFERQFGWLPLNKVVLMSNKGEALIGGQYSELIKVLHARHKGYGPIEGLFYYYDKHGLNMVATAPVSYRKQFLGNVTLSYAIDKELLKPAQETGYGQLFMVQDGKIIWTTLGAEWVGQGFQPKGGELYLNERTYFVEPISLSNSSPGVPSIWFAISNPELVAALNKSRTMILGLAVGGSLMILVVGFVLLRNFSGPLGRLVNMMRDVSEGRFPKMKSSKTKDEIGYLTNQFGSMVDNLREKQDEVNRVHAQLEQQATTDALTGIYNRHYLYDLYPKLWSEAMRQGKKLAVILIDLDLFKQINDKHGHLAGDQVLKQFSQILHDCCRVSDFIFRMGGEEFLVLTAGDIDGAQILAEKIRATVERTPFLCGGCTVYITVSVGLSQAEISDGRDGLSAVLNRVDKALYTAKNAGRNRVATWDMQQMRA